MVCDGLAVAKAPDNLCATIDQQPQQQRLQGSRHNKSDRSLKQRASGEFQSKQAS